MKRIVCVLAVGAMFSLATDAFAAEKTNKTQIKPLPAMGAIFGKRVAWQDPPPMPDGGPAPVAPPSVHEGAPPAGAPNGAPLFHCVEYKDTRNIHPCAVPLVVSVPDPCPKCHDPCSCCEPSCVNVQICVPPCGCPEIKTSHSGKRVTYDYGEYEVDITSKNGKIVVDYDD